MNVSTKTTTYYNELYKKPDAMRSSRSSYRCIMRGLLWAALSKAGVNKHGTALDVGCGQGQLTEIVNEYGLLTLGIDTSVEAIRRANASGSCCWFEVGDAMSFQWEQRNVVFCRSLSLYNTALICSGSHLQDVTTRLLSYVKPGGCLVWLYPSNLSPQPG